MKLIERKFVRPRYSTSYYWRLDKKDGVCALCGNELRRRFAIPRKATQIWVSLHTVPGANRWPMCIYDPNFGTTFIKVVSHNGIPATNLIPAVFGQMLEQFIGRRVYAEVTYEDKG